MNELFRCIFNIPPWGVKSGVRTITQSEVMLSPKGKKHKNTKKQQKQTQKQQQKPHKTEGGLTRNSKDAGSLCADELKDLAQKRRPNNRTQGKILRRCQQTKPLSSAETQDPPCQEAQDGKKGHPLVASLPITGIGYRPCLRCSTGVLCYWLPLVSRHRLGWYGAFVPRPGAIFCLLGPV